MIKEFKQKVQCPRCKKEHTVETAFGRWLRDQGKKELKPEDGHIFYDVDLLGTLWIAHTYKDKNYGKDLQFLMAIEVKTFGAEPDPAQRDTLNILGQVMRNRKETPNKKNPYIQMNPILNEVWSTLSKKRIRIKLFGTHLLQFSGAGPEDSNYILWDRKKINIDQLIKLLKFKIDPDILRPLDLRIHHRKEEPPLFYKEKGA